MDRQCEGNNLFGSEIKEKPCFINKYLLEIVFIRGFTDRQVGLSESFGKECGEGQMDLKVLLMVFGAIFVAELGDKTQLATLLFATDREVSKLVVFIGASLALIMTSAIGVLAGSLLSNYINEKYLAYAAGIGFIVIGIWTIARA